MSQLSIKPGLKSERVSERRSERSIVDVSKAMVPSKEVVGISTSPTSPSGVSKGMWNRFPGRGFLGETSLVFIGLIVSIIALSISLWSIHRNSVISSRLTDINSSVVDLIVSEKNNRLETQPVEKPVSNAIRSVRRTGRTVSQPDFSQAQSIMERIKSRSNTDLALEKLREQASAKPPVLQELENTNWLNKIERDTEESKKKALFEHNRIMAQSTQMIEKMKHSHSTPPILPDPSSLLVEPKRFSVNPQPQSQGKDKPIKAPKISELKSSEVPKPPTPADFNPGLLVNQFDMVDPAVEIDIDDLERDLAFLN